MSEFSFQIRRTCRSSTPNFFSGSHVSNDDGACSEYRFARTTLIDTLKPLSYRTHFIFQSSLNLRNNSDEARKPKLTAKLPNLNYIASNLPFRSKNIRCSTRARDSNYASVPSTGFTLLKFGTLKACAGSRTFAIDYLELSDYELMGTTSVTRTQSR